MSTKHTPGPWEATGLSDKGTYYKVRGSNIGEKWKIADCPFNKEDVASQKAEAEANARLIAAAPELLVALRNIVVLQYKQDYDGTPVNIPLGEYNDALSALEKALGDPAA